MFIHTPIRHRLTHSPIKYRKPDDERVFLCVVRVHFTFHTAPTARASHNNTHNHITQRRVHTSRARAHAHLLIFKRVSVRVIVPSRPDTVCGGSPGHALWTSGWKACDECTSLVDLFNLINSTHLLFRPLLNPTKSQCSSTTTLLCELGDRVRSTRNIMTIITPTGS